MSNKITKDFLLSMGFKKEEDETGVRYSFPIDRNNTVTVRQQSYSKDNWILYTGNGLYEDVTKREDFLKNIFEAGGKAHKKQVREVLGFK